MRLKLLSLSVMAMGAAALSGQALASGYNFGSQSVAAQGTAHANAAEAADPSTIYYNPAGMSELDGTQFQFGLTDVIPDSKYTDSGSSHRYLNGTTGLGLGGNQTNSSFAPSSVIAPTMYLSHKIDDKFTIGMGIFVPFGAKLGYGSNSVNRYALENISLQTINFNPSISFKLDEHNSFGFGLSAQYMKAKLQKAVDTQTGIFLYGAGLVQAGQVAQGTALMGLAPSLGDGQVTLDADGWGYGFNLGWLYKMDDHTRFGLAYRSRIRTTLDGTATWDYSGVSNVPAVQQALAASVHNTSSAHTTVDTPDSASASFYHDLTDKVAVMGTATWWGHSAMKNITINFDKSGEGAMVIQQGWKDSWTYALGMNYKYSDALLLRTGVAYEQSPVPNDNLRHVALPDSDRTWLSLGANYKFNKNNSIDFAYSYIWFKNANVNYTDSCNPTNVNSAGGSCTGNGETTKGSYKTNLQMIGLAYNYSF
ncbi:OmpP1/FadL family transporter [Paludibacterium purpuratum]|uniref:Long-chain fatty acid transport protein n=1 Tax=Paludibacterium purpuratum TaxID=1144873 RepID=A0A4R7AYL6_9NEIS|nr:OmpP1/FadL family transporter [Paludibacterium purpuratum]TDR73022.1 long-chain fatty acid transport protein [Paludibacterium purpuratum]